MRGAVGFMAGLPATVLTSLGFFGSSFALFSSESYAASASFALVAVVSVATHSVMGRMWIIDQAWKRILVLTDKAVANFSAVLSISLALTCDNNEWPAFIAFWCITATVFYVYHISYPARDRDWVYHHVKFHLLVQAGVIFLSIHLAHSLKPSESTEDA